MHDQFADEDATAQDEETAKLPGTDTGVYDSTIIYEPPANQQHYSSSLEVGGIDNAPSSQLPHTLQMLQDKMQTAN
eukprot:2894915-Ditylum_brightwellii.AAC.1